MGRETPPRPIIPGTTGNPETRCYLASGKGADGHATPPLGDVPVTSERLLREREATEGAFLL